MRNSLNTHTKHNTFKGLIDYIQTEVSTSKQKKFPLISFIDTPGKFKQFVWYHTTYHLTKVIECVYLRLG